MLLLDNCEHVLEPIADLVDRHPQHVSAGVDRGDQPRAPAGRGRAASSRCPRCRRRRPPAELFVERARAVAPGFEPAPVERAVVAEIVRRLDGLPLGDRAGRGPPAHPRRARGRGRPRRPLPPAVGRLPHVDPTQLAGRRGVVVVRPARRRRCNGPSSTCPRSPARSRSSAAAAVCDVDLHAAAATLDRLVERSLVMRAPNRRYVLLETLRAFGADRLTAVRRRSTPSRPPPRRVGGGRGSCPGRPGCPWDAHGDRGARCRSCAARSTGCSTTARSPRRLASSERCSTTASSGCAPTCSPGLAGSSTPGSTSPTRRCRAIWVATGYAAWMAGDMAEVGALAARLLDMTAGAGREVPSRVAVFVGSHDLFSGRLVDAARWFRHGGDDRRRPGRSPARLLQRGPGARLRRRRGRRTRGRLDCSTRSTAMPRPSPRTPGTPPARPTRRPAPPTASRGRRRAIAGPSSWPRRAVRRSSPTWRAPR